MVSNRQLFLDHIAQTSPDPFLLEIESAKGIFLFGPERKKYFDIIAGVSVSALGHGHPAITRAVKEQVDRYMHVMVYGELIQSPQINYAKLLSSTLGEGFDNTYFLNSGSEAIEGVIKLARKATGRSEVVSFRNAYHGSTLGALSVMGGSYYKQGYHPLIPDTRQIEYNSFKDLDQITTKTACVIAEPIQGEAGIIMPASNFLRDLRERCNQTGALLIFDEIQTGFGRTAELFAFRKFGVTPDVIVLAKSLGGGMPLGAFITRKEIMKILSDKPVLGHITTFGGHPVSCAAGLACLKTILKDKLNETVADKEQLFRKHLDHPAIKEIRGTGLLLAIELGSQELMLKTIRCALKNGVMTDWFLFCNTAIRISPPLIINSGEIITVCNLIKQSIDEATKI